MIGGWLGRGVSELACERRPTTVLAAPRWSSIRSWRGSASESCVTWSDTLLSLWASVLHSKTEGIGAFLWNPRAKKALLMKSPHFTAGKNEAQRREGTIQGHPWRVGRSKARPPSRPHCSNPLPVFCLCSATCRAFQEDRPRGPDHSPKGALSPSLPPALRELWTWSQKPGLQTLPPARPGCAPLGEGLDFSDS